MSSTSSDIEVGPNHNSPKSKLAPKLSIERWQAAFTSANLRNITNWLIAILASLLFVLIIIFSTKELKRQNHKLCLTQDCVTAAADLLRSMDTTADPCSDFFQYACGGWQKCHTIPEDEARIDTFTVMRNELTNTLRTILESPISENEGNATRKAKKLYLSCIDEMTIEKRKEEPLLNLLKREFGEWPILNSKWNESKSKFDWISIMGKLRQYNNEIIFGHNVGPHEHNASAYSIKLYPATLGLPSVDYYQNTSSRQIQAYLKLMIQITKLLQAPNETAMSDINNLLEFEIKLANISRPFEKQGGAIYQRLTIQKLKKFIPSIDWKRYFELAIPVQVNETEQIGVYGLDYFMDIGDLIYSTPKRTVVNYLLWRFVMNRANNLDSRFEKVQHDFFREIFGTKTQSARWKKCVDYVNTNMGIAVSALYVKEHFNSQSKAKAEEMIKNIKEIFFGILDEVPWMDMETRADAKVKALMMQQHIGYPEYINDINLLDVEYEHLDFDENLYFENVVGYLKNSTMKTQSKLHTEVDRDKWTIVPSVVNAHYHRYRNLMSFPAAVLQPPLYHPNYPQSLNYGAIGSVIGHEITHGFDSHGRHHDQYGNQRLWWHPNTIDRFIIKSQCMINQYSNYSMRIQNEDVKVNGMLTLSENIADNGGIKQSFRAYKKWESINGEEDPLPGLNLNHNQLFFLKFAQNWCQIMTPEGALNSIKSWKHAPGKFRVIGTLANSKEFAQAYKCPVGSPMNPTEKCEVW